MNIPTPISIAFAFIAITTIMLFYLATHKNKKALLIILTVTSIQGILAYIGFYSKQPLVVAKIPMVLAPSFIILFFTLFSKKGKAFVQSLNLKTLTILHTIRIPVELILFLLFTHKAIPEIMTFEGRNIDILAGITAPIIYYFAFVKNKIGPKALLFWNIICLLFLINIIIHSMLSFELPFQQFGFDQPNRGMLLFPFIWLPSIIVPIVFFSHLATIQRLLKKD